MTRFQDKRVLVTGGSRGIGKAIATGFAAEGAEVIVSSRSEASCAAAASAIGDRAVPFACDVTDSDAVKKLFAFAKERGGIDTLIACAGLASHGFAANVPEDELLRMWDVHFRGAIRCAQAAFPQLKQRQGSVVMVASIWAYAGVPGTLAYGSAKAALNHAVKVMGVEWAREGVRVNGLAPGFVETDMTSDLDPAMKDKMIRKIPLRRSAAPEEMAGPALFLASKSASYITGQTLIADGGERAR